MAALVFLAAAARAGIVSSDRHTANVHARIGRVSARVTFDRSAPPSVSLGEAASDSDGARTFDTLIPNLE